MVRLFLPVSIWGCLILTMIVSGKSVFGQQAKSTFSCDGRTSGYYADVSTGCQVYHMCDGLGRQFSYRCPSKTLFQQRMLICDHWYMVNCSKAEEDYSANLLIGQQGRRFVEDLQYHRTPRPDLADPRVSSNIVEPEGVSTEYFAPSHWSTEATPIKRQDSAPALVKQSYYRTDYNSRGKSLASGVAEGKKLDLQSVNQANLLSDTKESKAKTPSGFKAIPDSEIVGTVNFPSKFQATTPVYPKHVDFDPSRLSEFDISIDGNQPDELSTVNFPSKFKATTPVYPERVEFDQSKLSDFDIPLGAEDDEGLINFASNFQATTPVYPETVDVDLKKFSGVEELPPVESHQDESVIVNFASNFKATTPVYPQEVSLDLSKFEEPLEIPKANADDEDTVVNFVSSFRATTPVYPQSVEATSPIPEEFGLLPPKSDSNATQPNVVVNFASSFKATTPDYPKSVEATSPDPSNVGLAAPQVAAQPSADIEPPSFEDTFKRRIDDEPSLIGHTFNNQQLNEFMVTIKPEQLKDLKQLWKIPEYDFPLETVVRPGYESELSSFRSGGSSKS